jgi:hypothetical protein
VEGVRKEWGGVRRSGEKWVDWEEGGGGGVGSRKYCKGVVRRVTKRREKDWRVWKGVGRKSE